MNLSVNLAKVLWRLIEAYIHQAKPIGSATLQRAMGNTYATATLRLYLAKLEREGWLKKPHASAGRLPTSQALRWYVTQLQQSKLPIKDRNRLAQDGLKANPPHPTELWSRQLATLLAELTQQMVLIAVPHFYSSHLIDLGLVRLQPRLLLAYVISPLGQTHQTCIHLQETVSPAEVASLEQQLRTLLLHRSLADIRQELLQTTPRPLPPLPPIEPGNVHQVAQAVLPSDELQVSTAGLSHLLHQPEFQQIDQVAALLASLQDQATLESLVKQLLEQPGMRLLFGQDHALPQLQQTACMAMTISGQTGHRMTFGLLGPQRMNYRRLVPVLAYTGDLVQQYWATC